MKPKKLSDLRKKIDALDSSIINLINERAGISSVIGAIKHSKGQPIYSPDREKQVYSKVSSLNKGPMKDESIRAIYREMMSGCIALEKPMVIAYLGPELTFTHQAALKKFGSSVEYLPCDGISSVFREVERGNADYGVVPIENSTEGAVSHTLDLFVDSNLLICSEVYFPIKHCLLSKAKSLKAIKKVYSHPNVFGQCRGWIERNIPQAKLYEAASTTKASDIASKSSDSACIASELAASENKLNVLARSVEDAANNVTRFLIIGDHISKVTGIDKTSLVFSVEDKPGILHDMLDIFKKNKLNLTKIESRPSKKKLWKYYFFVDLEGHVDDSKVRKALVALKGKCNFVRILGSYPMEKSKERK